MRRGPELWFVCIVILSCMIISCSGTEISDRQVQKEFVGKTVSDILVIVIADEEDIRRSFESKFVEHLKAAGVEAVSSVDTISMPANLKLEKNTILDVVKKHGNDAVIVTYLVSIDDKETYNRNYSHPSGYYGYYSFAYSRGHSPGYASSTATVLLRTSLYDVKTEQRMWSGESKTWNKDSANEIINDVIKLVIKDLQKNKMIAPK